MTSTSELDRLREVLGARYTIERELGRGGMGAVYLARDVQLDRLVALKVLPSEFAVQPSLRERFLRETRTAASFSHPNIVPVYAVEESESLLAFAMGYVEGESLAERVRRSGPLTIRETVRLMQDAGYALAYAHGRGVVHRDIKPDNIMIERATGRALVMDFGISRTIAPPVANDGLTRVGEVVGTPEYMSPEQASGDRLDGRSDLYSLGLTAYFGVTGHPAISGDTTQKVLVKQLTEVLAPVSSARGDLPAPLANAIDRCVAKDPANRFQTAEALVDALDSAQLTAPDIPVPIRLFAQEAGTLGMIVVGVTLVSTILVRSSLERGFANLDTLLPVILLLAVVMTRVLQTFTEARRLSLAGFSPTEVLRGLEGVVAERESRRAELRADPRTLRARRKTLIAALIQLPVGLALVRLALAFRTRISDTQWRVSPAGSVLVMSGLVLLGVSLVLILKSPLRMPAGERLFRLVWLGGIGRWFVRAASVSDARKASVAARAVPAAPAAAPVRAKDRMQALERRVAALEEWRREGSR